MIDNPKAKPALGTSPPLNFSAAAFQKTGNSASVQFTMGSTPKKLRQIPMSSN